MSSFRRRTAVQAIQGTRPSPYNAAPLLSTGLTSIDDLLGGGLPLSTSLLLEADSPTAYADLLLRYWVAQGLECGQDVVVVASGVDGGPEGVVEALMDVDGGRTAAASAAASKEDAAEDEEEPTSVDSGTYCTVFDLTARRQLSSADRKLLHLIDVDELSGASTSSGGVYDLLYERVEHLVMEGGFRQSADPSAPRKALRIALSGYGSPSWGAASPAALFSFLHRLRHLLRQSHASCMVTFPAHLYSTSPPSASLPSSTTSSSPLLSRLSHAVDGVLRLTSFASSPLLSQTFPRHAGLLSTPKLPLLPPGTLLPPGSKLSILRGLGGGSDARDNLVGFRVKRRRFVVEVVSDDPVGAAGEDEEKREREKMRKRVEEANRKEREMAEGRSGADVLLGLGERVAQVRIGEADGADGGDAAGRETPRRGVRMGGVQLPAAGEEDRPPKKEKKVSVARMVHERPDLLDF
ncbi:Elongator subunit elp4 [Rhodotorula kratochvilovae]